MNELISIIVPVYNVEEYIERCVKSLITQTYKNIEILLINDGSTDNSEKICRRLEKNDSRISLYNKKNGGLSSARNYGIDMSNGEYLAFVDSDDFVSNEFLEILYNNLKENNADISICQLYKFSDNTRIKIKQKNTIKNFNKINGLKQLILGKEFRSQACNKLYKKQLFENIRYPEGKNYEDIGTTYLLFEKCNNIVVTSNKLYYYYMRNNSIIHNVSKKNILDFEENFIKRHVYLYSKYKNLLEDELNICFVNDIKMLHGYLSKIGDEDYIYSKKISNYYKECKKIERKNKCKLIKNQYGIRRKIEMLIFLSNRDLYCKIIRIIFRRGKKQ